MVKTRLQIYGDEYKKVLKNRVYNCLDKFL